MRWTVTVVFAGVFLLIWGNLDHADEAVMPDGRRVTGELNRDDQGRLLFKPTGKDSSLTLDQVDHVRFRAADAKPLFAASVHRLTLADGQTLTGELLDLDADDVRLRTAWAGELTIPRRSVASVAQPGHEATAWIEDFEAEPKEWKLSGQPAFGEKSAAIGTRSLLLTDGQKAEFTLPAPVTAGRLGVAFRLMEKSAELRWVVEMEFQTDGKSRSERIEVAGEGQPGDWRRLDVEFGPGTLIATVDGLVWHHDRENGPRQPLTRIQLLCEPVGQGPRQGMVAFDDVSLAVPRPPMRHQVADATQDEVWLGSGDGLFGKVVGADRKQVTFRTGGERPKELVLRWAEVRGLFFKQEPPLKSEVKEGIQLSLKPGTATEVDKIIGVVRGLDEKALTLAHPLLGELKVDRARLERLGSPRPAKVR